ncbi:hypothetical protein H6F98_11845 [Microcoleus sp. FACHB-SPT15]|uniref:hypothetical protein n=1 Tax=Microcoleus sp. FACHB-SPT15 TaxID=2692830 RepID=UPI001780234C|nr:hypothetical protein [Microcoleus sp. FACHB-SPT15]MBD1806140.1 hypothetical protein [Microcoleus sp. FACHB-SPT15]
MSLDIATFQSTLLETLSSQDEPDVIKATLQQEALSPALQDYVQTFEPEMVEIAAELVKKWGKRLSKLQ